MILSPIAIYSIGVTPLINMLIDIVVTSTESKVGVLTYAAKFSDAEELDYVRKSCNTIRILTG